MWQPINDLVITGVKPMRPIVSQPSRRVAPAPMARRGPASAPLATTTRAGNPPALGDRGNTDYTGTPFASRDSQWDDPLGADFSEGKADDLEAEGKDPASCMFC